MLLVRAASERVRSPLRHARKTAQEALTMPRETAGRVMKTAEGFAGLAADRRPGGAGLLDRGAELVMNPGWIAGMWRSRPNQSLDPSHFTDRVLEARGGCRNKRGDPAPALAIVFPFCGTCHPIGVLMSCTPTPRTVEIPAI